MSISLSEPAVVHREAPAEFDPQDGPLVILAAHNEAPRLPIVLADLVSLGLTAWVVDDASSDGTPEVAVRSGARVLRLQGHHGKTGALRCALDALPAEAHWVLFMDADGQHDPADIPRMWAAREGRDAVLGNRVIDRARMPLIRRATNVVMSWFLNMFNGGDQPDTQCGFRLVKADWLREWRPRGKHFEFESELYLHLVRGCAKMTSVPVRTVYAGEKSKIFWPRDAWRFLKVLMIGAVR